MRFLSIASTWEMQIKFSTGKLTLPEPPEQFVPTQRNVGKIQTLLIVEKHIWSLAKLSLHHRDPFDRLLIAQAIAEDYTLVSADPFFAQYPVRILS